MEAQIVAYGGWGQAFAEWSKLGSGRKARALGTEVGTEERGEGQCQQKGTGTERGQMQGLIQGLD